MSQCTFTSSRGGQRRVELPFGALAVKEDSQFTPMGSDRDAKTRRVGAKVVLIVSAVIERYRFFRA